MKRNRYGTILVAAGAGLSRATQTLRNMRNRSTQTTGTGGGVVSVVDANAQQYARSSYRLARRRKGFYRKLLRSAKEARYLRLQGITTFDTSGGYYPCNQVNNTSTDKWFWPLYLIDYKATNNVENGVDINGQVLWRLTTNTESSTGIPTFEQPRLQQSRQGVNDVASNVFQPENLGSIEGGTIQYPHRRTLISYIQAKFMFYGILTRPVRWRVELIRLKHDWLHPDFELSTDVATGAGVNVLNSRAGFWQYMLKPYTETPLCVQDPRYANMYTKVKTLCDFIIEPKLNTEPDADTGASNVRVPHQRQFDYFERMDAVVKYDWNDENTVDWANLSYQVNAGENKAVVKYRDRVYIMIRALAPVTLSSGTATTTSFDIQQDPSFDLLLRKKEIQLTG